MIRVLNPVGLCHLIEILRSGEITPRQCCKVFKAISDY